ncbi:MAG: DUF6505 family protein [Proteobacteria bacterium]|nr:DUF6505 family protein [Pseudomonadota bacterium]
MKLLRTIRLDPSDGFVFNRAAEPGEWAVAGTFVFWEQPLDGLIGKERAAFRSGLLGVSSLGWSTLAVAVEANEAERSAATEQLATQLCAHFGAPDLALARRAAAEEIAYSATLADVAAGTLVAVHRSVENGDIRERFRTLLPGGDALHNRAFAFEIVDDEAPEAVNLMALDQRGGGK